MNYKSFYQESNELAKERYELITQRIGEIAQKPQTKEAYAGYFKSCAAFLLLLADVYQKKQTGELERQSLLECEALNESIYADIMPAAYQQSYANPDYALRELGDELGQVLCLLAAHIRGLIEAPFRGDLLGLTVGMELFVGIYNYFEAEEEPDKKEMVQDIYWYHHDYSEMFFREQLRRIIDPNEDFETDIVMNSDLNDLRYLYRYGDYVGPDEKKIAAFLNTLPEEQIKAMADTYTEGYRIGFEVTGKDINKKRAVQIRYPIGFERMVRAAVHNFEKMGLKPTMLACSISPNKQFAYDHKEDRALYMDKAFVERGLEVRKTYLEDAKKIAAEFGGPAVIEVFGEEPFSPESKDAAFKYSEKQQQLYVYERNASGQILNQYIRGEERSFTIIAYPVPSIGSQFEEIFAETVKINTLDYVLYRDIQQKMIDVLDTAEKVHITGKGKNKTDLYVSIWPLGDPEKETAFENCVADVNIPVGEIFTSPVLKGTSGKLYVSQVYLNGLKYNDLEIDFRDGMVAEYTCSNFKTEEENRKYVKDNVLMHHDTLPMGEFAIGTNTTAYRMARTYHIADKLPILIAEKTGPHFAVGDTCYSHEEENISYNPDGKAIVARENAISALHREDGKMEQAYFNCHTDITIPYDELDRITVIRGDGSTQDIIADGRFVLTGTEELNRPLEQ